MLAFIRRDVSSHSLSPRGRHSVRQFRIQVTPDERASYRISNRSLHQLGHHDYLQTSSIHVNYWETSLPIQLIAVWGSIDTSTNRFGGATNANGIRRQLHFQSVRVRFHQRLLVAHLHRHFQGPSLLTSLV